jgi:hypothetical protein
MSEKLLASAVYESIRCMPAELCRLIAGFLIRQPHAWTAFEKSVDVVAGSANDEYDFRIQSNKAIGVGWRRLVSAYSFATAHLEWTVEFSCSPNAMRTVGVGVTTGPDNSYSDNCNSGFLAYCNMMRDGAILFARRYGLTFCAVTNGRMKSVGPLRRSTYAASQQPIRQRFRYDFVADPQLRTVSASVFQAVDNERFVLEYGPMTIVSDSTAATTTATTTKADFESFRPCIVLGLDSVDVFVRSISS